jgi:outer membrane protein assembly factor BamB
LEKEILENTKRSTGNGFSPVIYGNQVFVTHDHEGDSAIYSLNRENGHTLWKVRRDGSKPSSSTPVIYKVQSGETLLSLILNLMAAMQ